MDSSRDGIGHEFHAALVAADWDRLRALMAPDVTWTLPGENTISGTVSGADEVIARAVLIASYGVTFTLEHVLVSRDHMALALHNTARRGDVVLDERLATVCRLDGGTIVEIETFLSDEPGMNAFFV